MEEKLERLVAELTRLGEDAGELKFWQSIFGTLTDGEKERLLADFEKEIAELKKIS